MDKAILLAKAYEIMLDISKTHFSLKNPVILKIRTSKKFNAEFAGMWSDISEEEGVTLHQIELAYNCHINNDSQLAEVLAHELCHAEQYEKGGTKKVLHNRVFFSRLDYVLFQIGLPATDLQYRKLIKRY